MINYEIKSQLAKLLATENMVVENANVETAQFDVERRVLTLPMWKRASNTVYDMLVGHEVGHALYTPNDWSWEDRIPKQFVNVTEDARIEKLMKRRYPGLSKSFYQGYKELAEDDFFGLEDEDLSTYNLADRANLHYKIGNFVDIPFTDEEMKYVDMMGETETFADAVMVAEEIYKFCKVQSQKEESVDVPLSGNGSGQGMDQEQTEQQQSTDFDEGEGEEDFGELEDLSEGRSKPQSTTTPEPEVKTDDIFESGKEEFNGNVQQGSRTFNYLEVPKVDVDKVVASNKQIHQQLNDHWVDQLTPKEYYCAYTETTKMTEPRDFGPVDAEYDRYKKSSQKEVNYLVKEFECKKSADAYSRSFSSKTGTLDCSKLHTYKYNEDLFRKVNVIPDGKNHGLIFILDWSGSMGDCLLETMKQLFNLIQFCSKVNIPFDVYAFTNNYQKSEDHFSYTESPIQEVKEYDMIISPDFSLLHFFTSDVNKKQLDQQMRSLYRVAYNMVRWCNYSIPVGFNLSGTPLNEAIVCLHQLITQFKTKYKVQKINTVILTDGEANVLPFYKVNNYYDDERMGSGRVYMGDFIRNRKTGHTYKVEGSFHKFTEVLLEDLKTMNPGVNVIGFRLASNSDFKGFVRRYDDTMTEDSYKKIKKNKSVAIKTSGYTSYFGILSSSLDNDTEFDVEEGASKAKIRSAFVKNLNAKSLNRKVLSQFVDIIS